MALRPFTLLSLCSGIGGLDLALRLAVPHARIVAYCERDPDAASVLVAGMGEPGLDDAPVWDDLATFPGRAFRGIVDCVMAGFPCQPWSQAGQRRGTADARWLWPDIARIVRDVGPRYVFLENVPGLLAGGLGHVFGDLAEMGFAAEWDVFSAGEMGAPHRRDRVFILADCHGFHAGERDAKPTRRTTAILGPDGPELANATPDGRVQSGRARTSRARFADGSASLADPASGQFPQPWREAEGGEGAGPASPPVFPPGPDDARWADILAQWPTLAPAVKPEVRGVDDGCPGRADQLRMLGNGVVPVVAAYAFRALYARLGA